MTSELLARALASAFQIGPWQAAALRRLAAEVMTVRYGVEASRSRTGALA